MEPSYTNNQYLLHLDHYRLSLFGEKDQRELWKKATNDIIFNLQAEFDGCESTSEPLYDKRYSKMDRLKYGNILIDIAHSVRKPSLWDAQERYILNKGWIRITNENKADYRPHHEVIRRVEGVLAEYDESDWWQTQYAEIAVDTTDPKRGKEMLLRGYPRYWQGDRPEIPTTGLEQYFGNNEARKRHHAYVRGDIYRWEIKVGRDTLNAQDMNSYAQVIARAPDLLNKSLCWMEPKPGLSRHYKRMTVDQAVNALQKKTSLSTGQVIDKYFKRQPFPDSQVVH